MCAKFRPSDFINKIEEVAVPEGSLIISLDVTSLYTSIPHAELRNVLQDVLDSRENLHPPMHFILDLIDTLLENNYFRYDASYYLQTKGVAKGSAFAPSAVNLFMANFEQSLILNPLVNPNFQHISRYYRFIDDIFRIYTDPKSYGAFINWLNALHPTIKFTAEGDQHTTDLDTTVHRTQQNTLAVRPLKKATDKNTYLHFRSYHLRTLCRSIPYGQFLHIRRNSTSMQDYVWQSNSMQENFLSRGYPRNIVSDAARKAQVRNRQELLSVTLRDESFKGITAAIDFTPLAPAIKRIIHKHWHLVNNIPGCKDLPRLGLRRTSLIKEMVTKSDIREKTGPR